MSVLSTLSGFTFELVMICYDTIDVSTDWVLSYDLLSSGRIVWGGTSLLATLFGTANVLSSISFCKTWPLIGTLYRKKKSLIRLIMRDKVNFVIYGLIYLVVFKLSEDVPNGVIRLELLIPHDTFLDKSGYVTSLIGIICGEFFLLLVIFATIFSLCDIGRDIKFQMCAVCFIFFLLIVASYLGFAIGYLVISFEEHSQPALITRIILYMLVALSLICVCVAGFAITIDDDVDIALDMEKNNQKVSPEV